MTDKIMRYFQKNTRQMSILGVILILNLLFFMVFSITEYSLYNDSEGALSSTEMQVKRSKKEMQQINQLLSTISSIKNRSNQFLKNDLKDVNSFEINLTRVLYTILEKNNINFQHINYGEKNELDGKIVRKPIHIPVKATYLNFRKLIAELENLPFPTVIEKISISSAAADEINATVDLVSFYREAQ